MNAWVLAVLAIIAASIIVSAWKQYNFSIIVSMDCVLTYILMYVAAPSSTPGMIYELGFSPHDLLDPGRVYTVATSMYAHASMTHLFLNLLGIMVFGLVFEQKIGTRPYILLYLLTGLCGTLTFAAARWLGTPVIAVGASGAIFGILGAFARLYPRERFMIILIPVAIPMWGIVVGYLLLQLLLIPTASDIAFEAHIGGLVAGLLLAPLVVRLPSPQRKVTMAISSSALGRLATTSELKMMLKRIEDENVPDVRNAWINHFISKAKCPQCGAPMTIKKGTIKCEKGHLI